MDNFVYLEARNDKVFKNLDRDPQEIQKIANSEATTWEGVQVDDCNLDF